MERKPMGVYVHIPFCIRKCRYCDFLSFQSGSAAERENYLNALLREIRLCGGCRKDYRAETLFIGGGTPSILEPGSIRAVLDALNESFELSQNGWKEATIECNPGTLTEEKLAVYRECGINRLSIGVQSADEEELKALGRIHTWEEFLHGYELARRAGFANINIDLMSGLPGQSLRKWQETLKKTAALGPEHISAYSLIIEEGTPFYDLYGRGNPVPRGQMPLPDEDTEREMYEWTKSFLEQEGYRRYEISNYAKPGYECRHNQTYWKRIPYLGLGLGASSFLRGKRWHNTDNYEEYLKCAESPQSVRKEEVLLTEKESMEEFMFLGLRMCDGIKKEEFRQEFGVLPEKVYGPVLKRLIKDGLMAETADGYSLTARGIDVSNPVLAQFLFD